MSNVMFLTPSKILYTHRCDPDICSKTENTFTEVTKTLQRGTVFPKLQVVKKDGFYFTLNDAKLQVYRHLEKLGQCGRVEVERVPLKDVPEGIRQLMTAPEQIRRQKDTKHKGRGKYQSVSATLDVADDSALVANPTESADDITDDNEESSDYADTDSDFSDWSDEEPSATDLDSEGDKNNHCVEDNDDDYEDAHLDEEESFI